MSKGNIEEQFRIPPYASIDAIEVRTSSVEIGEGERVEGVRRYYECGNLIERSWKFFELCTIVQHAVSIDSSNRWDSIIERRS